MEKTKRLISFGWAIMSAMTVPKTPYERVPSPGHSEASSSTVGARLLSEDSDIPRSGPRKSRCVWSWHWVFHGLTTIAIIILTINFWMVKSKKTLTHDECWARFHMPCTFLSDSKSLKALQLG